jgi:hypothetical protein
MVPLLSLGIPCGAASALVLGAMMIYGVVPGPMLISQSPQIFWGVIGSMYVGNLMLLLLNLPLIPLWVKTLKTPYPILFTLDHGYCKTSMPWMNPNDIYRRPNVRHGGGATKGMLHVSLQPADRVHAARRDHVPSGRIVEGHAYSVHARATGRG